MTLVHDLITLYIFALLAVSILSWFPTQDSSGGLAATQRVLTRLTEPVLRPLRSIMPRPVFGGVGVDFSVFVAIIILLVINSYI